MSATPPCLPPVAEADRLRALAWYDVLDTVPEQVFDDIAQLAAITCGTPMAVLSFVDGERQWFKARVGLDAASTPRSVSFCAHGIISPGALLVVPDPLEDPRFRDNPLVLEDPRIRFYAGAPLVTPEGLALGMLAVLDHRPRQIDERRRDALFILARQAMVHLETRKAMAVLASGGGADDALHGKVERVLDRVRALQRALARREG